MTATADSKHYTGEIGTKYQWTTTKGTVLQMEITKISLCMHAGRADALVEVETTNVTNPEQDAHRSPNRGPDACFWIQEFYDRLVEIDARFVH